jgi:nucleoside-diphosphate-sugar epimerase
VYGNSTGPIKALGVIQLLMREKTKELGFVPYVGEGSTIFNVIHVNAIAPFVLLMLDLALKEEKPNGSVYERCYIIGGQEVAWKEVAEIFARVFHARGLVASPEPKSVELSDAGEGEIPMLMASSVKFISPRAEALGYKHEYEGLEEFLVNSDIF